MFRIGKRSFSIRESPSKLSSLSPSPCKIQSSPIKRVKLSTNSSLISSTFLQESRIDEDFDKIQDKAENNEVISRVETPPPSPENKVDSRLEVLTRRCAELEKRKKEMELKLENKFKELEEVHAEIAEQTVKRYKFEDCLEALGRGQAALRNHLNEIYNPGNQLAEQAAVIMEGLRRTHERKYERLALELNDRIDKSKHEISIQFERLNHEIDLHERTLMTIMSSEVKNEVNPEPALDVEAKSDQEEEQQEEQGEEQEGEQEGEQEEEQDEEQEEVDNDDCIIIDNPSDIISINGGESKNKPDETDEDTDIEDDQGDNSNSFTPRQAQRPH